MARLGSPITWLVALLILGGLAVVGVTVDTAAFVGSLFAAFISLFAVYLVEAQLRPAVHFTIPSPTDLEKRRFLHVLVHNKTMTFPLSTFLDRRPALMTSAWITFLTEDGQPVFRAGHRMRGRWARTPEPVRPLVADGNRVTFLVDRTLTTDSIDIPPGSSEKLDVVMKVRGESMCKGWHNGFIQNPNPSTDDVFGLPSGRYLARIEVTTGGRRFEFLAWIVNDVPFEHFRLDPTDA